MATQKVTPIACIDPVEQRPRYGRLQCCGTKGWEDRRKKPMQSFNLKFTKGSGLLIKLSSMDFFSPFSLPCSSHKRHLSCLNGQDRFLKRFWSHSSAALLYNPTWRYAALNTRQFICLMTHGFLSCQVSILFSLWCLDQAFLIDQKKPFFQSIQHVSKTSMLELHVPQPMFWP